LVVSGAAAATLTTLGLCLDCCSENSLDFIWVKIYLLQFSKVWKSLDWNPKKFCWDEFNHKVTFVAKRNPLG